MWFRATEAAAPSLRRRLLWLVLAAIAVASAIQAASAYRTALRNADALLDLQLQQLAHSIDAGVPLLPGEAQVFEFSVQVWGPGGVRLFRSQGIELPQPAVLGFSDLRVAGTAYRVYRLDTGRRTIQVAQDLDARRARARGLAFRAVLPVLLLAPLLMAAVWLLISSSFAPVDRMRRQVARRAAEDLSPLPETGLPAEVQPLVHELNALFRRVDAAFASQRHFVADAAHELRSPLTALKLQAQALRQLPPGPQQEPAWRRLDEAIERAIALLSQLLQLAGAESEGPLRLERVDLQDICRDVIGEALAQARRKDIDLGMQTPEAPAFVRGEPETLRILLRNLVVNALKFTPAGGRVDVSLLVGDEAVVLRVEDNGPGIPEPERERVFDRFYRGSDQDAPGSGLGLPIVQAIARRHRAQVRLGGSSRLGGLQVDVRFPAA
jgi:two-component system OmpR family sensor kinase